MYNNGNISIYCKVIIKPIHLHEEFFCLKDVVGLKVSNINGEATGKTGGNGPPSFQKYSQLDCHKYIQNMSRWGDWSLPSNFRDIQASETGWKVVCKSEVH